MGGSETLRAQDERENFKATHLGSLTAKNRLALRHVGGDRDAGGRHHARWLRLQGARRWRRGHRKVMTPSTTRVRAPKGPVRSNGSMMASMPEMCLSHSCCTRGRICIIPSTRSPRVGHAVAEDVYMVRSVRKDRSPKGPPQTKGNHHNQEHDQPEPDHHQRRPRDRRRQARGHLRRMAPPPRVRPASLLQRGHGTWQLVGRRQLGKLAKETASFAPNANSAQRDIPFARFLSLGPSRPAVWPTANCKFRGLPSADNTVQKG